MLKSQRDSVVSGLSVDDRHNMRQVIAAIKEARGGSPDLAAAEGRITAREILEGWQEELPDQVRSALEATLMRDETRPEGWGIPDGLRPEAIGFRGAGALVGLSGQTAVALAFGSYT